MEIRPDEYPDALLPRSENPYLVKSAKIWKSRFEMLWGMNHDRFAGYVILKEHYIITDDDPYRVLRIVVKSTGTEDALYLILQPPFWPIVCSTSEQAATRIGTLVALAT